MPASQEWRNIFAAIHERSTPTAEGDTLSRALALGSDVAPGIAGCSLTELDGAYYRTPAASTRLALDLDRAQYADAAGPCIGAARDGQPYHLPDLNDESRFVGFRTAALQAGVRSSLSVPVGDLPRPTALNLYSTVVSAFGTEHARGSAKLLARTIAALSVESVLTSGSADEASEVVDARKNGDRVRAAVNRVMRDDGLTRAAAFNVLTRRSCEQQVSLLTVADQVLSG